MWNKRALGIAIVVLAGACDATMSVYSVVGSDEVFTGTATGNGERGTINLNNGQGKACVGQFVGSPSTGGQGLLTCNDGERAQIQYTVITWFSGYGFGTTNNGRSLRFTYGLSREEGEKYIGQSTQTTSTTAGNPQRPASRGSGSGFFITRQGHVLTNAHVVEGCKELAVARVGEAASTARIVSIDKQNDLALLTTGSAASSVAAFRGRPVRQGETIIAYGFPYAGSLSSGGSITTGSISALSGLRDDTRYFQMSAPVQPGNSGGPLLDSTGAVVGVVSSGLRGRGSTSPQNVNFAIKAEVARTFLSSTDISPETSTASREVGIPDIGDRARAFTVHVECKG
jgi:S1-C subfamily serine protease